MKKIFFVFTACALTSFGYTAMAQEEVIVEGKKLDKKESQEIIIRKKGDQEANIIINISGDKVTINGKPLIEFKDDAITINKRNIIVRETEGVFMGDGLRELGLLGNLTWDGENADLLKAAFLGVTTEKNDNGAKITDISKEGAAAKAGLKENDIITKVGDTKIDGPESLSKAIRAKKPTDEVKIHYLRDGKEKSVKATLQERIFSKNVFSYSSPDGTMKTLTIPQVRAYEDQARAYSDQARAYADMHRDNIAPRVFTEDGHSYNFDMNSFPRQKKLGLKIQDTEDGNGVKVLDVADSSAAATAGVKKDDIITEIGGVKVTNTDEVREQLMDNSEKSSYIIKARRNGNEMSFNIKIPKKLKTANL